MGPPRPAFEKLISPIIHLSSNWVSRIGVVLVTSAVVFWLFLFPMSVRGAGAHPYLGILEFFIIPSMFFAGLGTIPIGMWLRVRRERKSGAYPSGVSPLALHRTELRRLLIFVGVTTVVNLILGSLFTYQAVGYMDSVTFCGETCHKVMHPEFAAYQNSPHSRVECVACHIGPGASWFVKSKLSGVGQVFAVAFNTYPRPIPTPVRNLRPARETCEACHWPQKFGEDRLRVIYNYADDERNTLTKTVLLMRLGGGHGSPGIHGAHLGPGVAIHYSPADDSRQTIPRVEYQNSRSGRAAVYVASDARPDALKKLPTRLMDCMDCHNRPTHTLELPERAVNNALASGAISPSLPFVKKRGVELLKKPYVSQEEAAKAIPAALGEWYRDRQPAEVARAAQALVAIYRRNVFPEMKVTWGTYPNNVGHTDFLGCFRCHDDNHSTADGKKIVQECNTCHQLLAMDDPAPKILTDLGLQ
jgi:nitrate/TMAO reductase-like tetraheme cytochrome c subunit